MPFALVTGASKGIGKAIAELLAGRGYDLLLIARSSALLEESAAALSLRYKVQCFWLAQDLALPEAARAVHDWCGHHQYPVDVLVNNAGYGLSGPFEQHSEAEHDEMLRLNINTLVGLCRLFTPDLRKRPSAYILNIASTAAYQAVPFLSAYAASKAFVLSFSRGLREELKGSSVSVTCISPGPTDTHFGKRAQINLKAQKAADKFNMSPESVALTAVKSLFAKKAEVVTGGVNKLSVFLVWLLPKAVVESIARKLYD
jgi:uncharacterized protein